MQINDLNALFSQVDEGDLWENIIDETKELYAEKGGNYVVRIIGPVILLHG